MTLTEDEKPAKNPDEQNSKEFLMKMYEKCWENATNAEDALWKVFASYTAVFAGLALAKDMIGFFGFVVLVTIFSLIGMFTAINANSWFTRNMGIISNLEKNFIPQYLNKIIPKSWTEHKLSFINPEIWWIMFFLFPIVIAGCFYVLYDKLSDNERQIILGVIGIGFVLVFIYFEIMRRRYKKFTEEAKG